jgi:hypothetical protein
MSRTALAPAALSVPQVVTPPLRFWGFRLLPEGAGKLQPQRVGLAAPLVSMVEMADQNSTTVEGAAAGLQVSRGQEEMADLAPE